MNRGGNVSEVVCKLCKVVLEKVSEVSRDGFFEAVSVHGYKSSQKMREQQDACGAARRDEDALSAILEVAALDASFKLSELPGLGELAEDL